MIDVAGAGIRALRRPVTRCVRVSAPAAQLPCGVFPLQPDDQANVFAAGGHRTIRDARIDDITVINGPCNTRGDLLLNYSDMIAPHPHLNGIEIVGNRGVSGQLYLLSVCCRRTLPSARTPKCWNQFFGKRIKRELDKAAQQFEMQGVPDAMEQL